MAKSNFQCADCGAEVQIHGRNRRDADALAEWHEDAGHLCGECRSKQIAADGAEAADSNRAAGLPPLLGSEKQVAWAETLRIKMLPAIDRVEGQ